MTKIIPPRGRILLLHEDTSNKHKFSNGKDIVFDEDDSLTKSNVVHGVNKVISTVPINRN